MSHMHLSMLQGLCCSSKWLLSYDNGPYCHTQTYPSSSCFTFALSAQLCQRTSCYLTGRIVADPTLFLTPFLLPTLQVGIVSRCKPQLSVHLSCTSPTTLGGGGGSWRDTSRRRTSATRSLALEPLLYLDQVQTTVSHCDTRRDWLGAS